MKVDKKVLASEEFIFSAIICLGAVALSVWMLLTWPNKPRIIPLALCLFIGVLLAVHILNILVRGKPLKAVGRIPGRVIAGFAALGLTVAIASWFNLVVAAAVLAVLLNVIYGERRWWAILSVGVSSGLLMYFLFGRVLGIALEF